MLMPERMIRFSFILRDRILINPSMPTGATIRSQTICTILLLTGMFLLGGISGLAQTPFLAGTASKNSVAQGEQFTVTYSFNGQGRSFQGPDLSEFNVLGGPSQSNNVQIVNGNFSQSISFTYYLSGKNPGSYKIGPASIDAEGKRIASNVIQMTVTKGTAPAQSRNDGSGESVINSKNLFVRAIPARTSCMKGEGIPVTFRLFSALSVVDFAIPKMPGFDGFWNQEISLPQTLDRSTEVIDGVRFTVWDIKKLVLFPQQSGNLTIDPMEVECLVRVKVNNSRFRDPFGMFDDPFFGNVRDVKHGFKSAPVRIRVDELPQGAGPGFSGAVGTFNFEAKLDRSKVKANESVTLKIKVSGNGNLKLAELPEPELPGDLETYDPKTSEQFKAGPTGVNGSKTAEYLIIPRNGGVFEIPELRFTYYDPGKRNYITRTAGPFTLNVEGQVSAGASIGGNTTAKNDVRLIGSDVRYIHTGDPQLHRSEGSFSTSVLYKALFISPFLLIAGLLVWKREERKRAGNADVFRIRNAGHAAKRRLSSSRKLLEKGQDNAVYEEIQRALWGYLSDRFSIEPSRLSKETVRETLSNKGIAFNATERILSTIDNCDLARYAGSVSGLSCRAVYDEAEHSIREIESCLHT
ncbi:MAG: BatD family protein [Bacteroidota bacterium]